LALSKQQQRAEAAYMGLAIGDALGATVEFMTPREIQHHYGVHREIVGGGWLKLKPGQVTDDTTMSLALGGAILSSKGVDAQAIATAFDGWMRAKPVDIGNTVRRGLLNFRNSGNPISPYNEYDAGNGACMRTLPIALATLGQGEEAVLAALQAQAHVTHNNPVSDAGTFCVVTMVQGALLGASLVDLLNGPVNRLIEEYPDFAFRRKRNDNPSGYIVDTLRVVFEALFDTDNFEDCLVHTVNQGGDADTTGAIAGMVAGAIYGAGEIPLRWKNSVEPSVSANCCEQARQLLAMSPSYQEAAARVEMNI
jgi:ADP-ribosyl-[dinitrogen reductase] hydrolase